MQFNKLSIYVPHSTKKKLEEDAKQFEFFKSNGTDINLNRFLGDLLLGYYNQFYLECQQNTKCVEAVLMKHIRETTVGNISNVSKEILQELSKLPQANSNKKGGRLSLKPTSRTNPIIQNIIKSNIEGNTSNIFTRLFESYLNKPTYIREQIVRKETYDTLQSAINSDRSISFSTHKKPQLVRNVYPYSVSHGKEELFNYLLCAEYNSDGVLQAKSFRISRIKSLVINADKNLVDKVVIDHLKKMEMFGPAYEINDNEPCAVFLTEEGHQSYNQIYFQRPPFSAIKIVPNGYVYHFTCSKENVERYFRRFNPGQAKVISPEWLRKKIQDGYQVILNMYKEK